MKTNWVKRLVDIFGSSALIMLLSPFLLLTALVIAVESEGSVFFTQPRVGCKGRRFHIYKFRTMCLHTVDYQNLKEVEAGNPYITRVGRLLRRYGIDELPQLLNILKGEMSFIGPRPTIQEQVEKYTAFQRRRLDIRPGITGLAQVSGNTSLSWNDRITLDIWYINHWSFLLDVFIFLRTIAVVIKGQVMGQPVEQASFLPSLFEALQYAKTLE